MRRFSLPDDAVKVDGMKVEAIGCISRVVGGRVDAAVE
jgi:hypothetical protein